MRTASSLRHSSRCSTQTLCYLWRLAVSGDGEENAKVKNLFSWEADTGPRLSDKCGRECCNLGSSTFRNTDRVRRARMYRRDSDDALSKTLSMMATIETRGYSSRMEVKVNTLCSILQPALAATLRLSNFALSSAGSKLDEPRLPEMENDHVCQLSKEGRVASRLYQVLCSPPFCSPSYLFHHSEEQEKFCSSLDVSVSTWTSCPNGAGIPLAAIF